MDQHRILIRWGLVLLAACVLFAPSAKAQNDAASLFKSKCASCHGADGAGDTPVGKAMKLRDMHSAEVQKQTDAQITNIISAGKSPMPAYKGKLTDDQIKQLEAYVRTPGKK